MRAPILHPVLAFAVQEFRKPLSRLPMRAEMLMQKTAAPKFIPNIAPVAPGEAFQDWAALAVANAERWIFITMNDAMGDSISTVPATTQAPR